MIEFNNKKILVLGLGKSGRAAIRLLKTLNVEVFVSDAKVHVNPEDSLYEKTQEIPYGKLEDYLNKIDMIVKSPGIPYDLPFIEKAKNNKIMVISEVELGYQLLDKGKVIVGVTGTNGKTTTTSLITKILKDNNIDAVSVGNIGYCLCDAVYEHEKADVFVVECSSFQLLDIVDFKPHIAILLNLSKAHLDYHHTFDHYVNAKMNLFKKLTHDSFLVYNADQKLVRKKVRKIKCSKYSFSLTRKKEDTYIEDGVIKYNGHPILSVNEIQLPGKHNIGNILAAVTTAKIFYIENSMISKAVQDFKSLPHRLQRIDKVEGLTYYNDSKSTNHLSSICALDSFNQPVILILGGYDRNQDFTDIINHRNVSKIIAYGETKERILKKALEKKVPCYVCFDLNDAVKLTQSKKTNEEIVLFSPASASWDQFKNYEERGDTFIKYVKQLKDV